MTLHIPDKIVKAATAWMESERLAFRICHQHFATVRNVRLSCLRGYRLRRVILVEFDGHKCVIELSPKLSWMRVSVAAATTAAHHCARVARLIGSDTRVSALLRFGTAYAMFEYVDGRHPCYDCPVEELVAIAETYAHLHSATQTSRVVGGQVCWNMEQYVNTWNTIVREHHNTSDLCRWLVRHQPRDVEFYQLVHGDANKHNTILTSNRGAILIDLGSIRFGFAPFELVFLLLHYGRNDTTRRLFFLEAYRRCLQRGWELWERKAPFWLVGGLMERVRWRMDRAKAYRAVGNWDMAERRSHDALRLLEYVVELTRQFPTGTGDLTEVISKCRDESIAEKLEV